MADHVTLNGPMVEALRVLAERYDLADPIDVNVIVLRRGSDGVTATIVSDDWGPVERYELRERSPDPEDVESARWPYRTEMSRSERLVRWWIRRRNV
jgi:hypothetical protein